MLILRKQINIGGVSRRLKRFEQTKNSKDIVRGSAYVKGLELGNHNTHV